MPYTLRHLSSWSVQSECLGLINLISPPTYEILFTSIIDPIEISIEPFSLMVPESYLSLSFICSTSHCSPTYPLLLADVVLICVFFLRLFQNNKARAIGVPVYSTHDIYLSIYFRLFISINQCQYDHMYLVCIFVWRWDLVMNTRINGCVYTSILGVPCVAYFLHPLHCQIRTGTTSKKWSNPLSYLKISL